MKDSASRRPLLRCDSSGPLYTLRLPASTAPPSTSSSAGFAVTPSSTTWHRRLGHPGRDVLAPLSHAFDLIHCDLWTSPVLSMTGNKYYLVIVDDFFSLLLDFPFARQV